jgi:hypothetical protein
VVGVVLLAVLSFVAIADLAITGLLAYRLTRSGPVLQSSIVDHFKYGSIGSEPESGLPYWMWKAIPGLFPEVFHGKDFEVFGFLYETDASGKRRDLPIGVGRRRVMGVDVAWLNCAVCHTGTVRQTAGGQRQIVLGMPSNNLDLSRFVTFILGLADDPRLAPDSLIPAMERAGADFDWLDRLVWRYAVIPILRQGLLDRNLALGPLQAVQPAWGPGRVDTFNPYKLIQFGMPFADLTVAERIGTADFPSIFNQAPRVTMNLHWDGNNNSLAERNLSAALGAGATQDSVDHASVERVAAWLQELHPPPSPYRPDPTLVAHGRELYMSGCAGCHGYQQGDQYVFQGAKIGLVDPISGIETDPARLNSYTEKLRDYQLTLFAGTPYHFSHFKKTDGYANLPLDGLWLRAPYLHNGSVPTLYDLLLPPDQRPKRFVRGLDVLDGSKGGFSAPDCTPGASDATVFCYDTALPGNGNGGHLYGTDLSQSDKDALLAYLLTF